MGAKQIGRDLRGPQHAVQRRVEEVVANHDESGMVERLRLVRRSRVA